MALIDRLTAIGDAIREKNGTTEPIPLVDMPQAILDIVSGGNETETFNISTLETTLPTNLHACATARVNDKIYLFGGYNSSNGSRTNTILIYDITNNTLSNSTQTLGESINDFPAVAIGTDIYTFGGNKGSGDAINKVYKYDTLTHTLEHYDSLPITVCSCTICYYDGYIYIFGGQKSNTILNSIYRYDVANKTSELLNITLPQKTMSISSSGVLVGNVFYVFGGTNSSTNTNGYNTIYAIDLLNQTVDTLDIVLPYGARDFSAIYFNNAVYLFGGKSNSLKKDAFVFKPDSRGITYFSNILPTATCNINIAEYNNQIYLVGGEGLKTINVFSIENQNS